MSDLKFFLFKSFTGPDLEYKALVGIRAANKKTRAIRIFILFQAFYVGLEQACQSPICFQNFRCSINIMRKVTLLPKDPTRKRLEGRDDAGHDQRHSAHYNGIAMIAFFL